MDATSRTRRESVITILGRPCPLLPHTNDRYWQLEPVLQGISPMHSVSESSNTDPWVHLRAILSEADCAFIQLSDPVSLTATFEKKARSGFPSAVPS